MLEFSSGSFPPFPPFRGCATDDNDAGGDDEGVPGEPEKKKSLNMKNFCNCPHEKE